MGVGLSEWRLRDRPMPDVGSLRVSVTMLVDHDDRTKRRFHDEPVEPDRMLGRMVEWEHKYPAREGYYGHRYLVGRCEKPKGFDDRLYDFVGQAPVYFENTDFLPTYRASGSVTNAIQSLGSSSTLLAGYESAVVDYSSTKALDVWMSGTTMVGTTPTANTTIEHDVVTEIADGVWPDVFDGTTSAETVTSQGIKDNICTPFVLLNVDATTSNLAYPYTKRSVGALFGGFVPAKWVVFTTHNTGANLNATGGNQVLTQTGVYISA